MLSLWCAKWKDGLFLVLTHHPCGRGYSSHYFCVDMPVTFNKDGHRFHVRNMLQRKLSDIMCLDVVLFFKNLCYFVKKK